MLIQNTNEKMHHAGYTAPLTCTCTRARIHITFEQMLYVKKYSYNDMLSARAPLSSHHH